MARLVVALETGAITGGRRWKSWGSDLWWYGQQQQNRLRLLVCAPSAGRCHHYVSVWVQLCFIYTAVWVRQCIPLRGGLPFFHFWLAFAKSAVLCLEGPMLVLCWHALLYIFGFLHKNSTIDNGCDAKRRGVGFVLYVFLVLWCSLHRDIVTVCLALCHHSWPTRHQSGTLTGVSLLLSMFWECQLPKSGL